jgi:cobaltochelatase CobN
MDFSRSLHGKPWIAAWVLVLLACLAQPAAAQQADAASDVVTITLAPRDGESEMAIELVNEFRQDPAFANVRFNLFPWRGSDEADVAAMAASDVALVSNMGREIAEAVAPAITIMSSRGAKAFAFGGSFEEVERAAGMTPDEALLAYGSAGGKANWRSMIRYVLTRDFGFDLTYDPPVAIPPTGLWNWRTGEVFSSFEAYRESYLRTRPADAAERPFVGIVFNRGTAVMGKPEEIAPIAEALEARGLNVLSGFAYPAENVLEDILIREGGGAHVEAIVGIAFKFNNVPDRTIPIMERAGVPVINALGLLDQTQEEWEQSAVGVPMSARGYQIASPEFAGLIAPTVYAVREERTDPVSGLQYVAEAMVPERVERLAERIAQMVRLRQTPNAEKRVAIMYYNFPPGRENVGAAYLNVLPDTLWGMLNRLRDEGYDVGELPASARELGLMVQEYGVNIPSWEPDAIDRLARSGRATLLPVAQYRQWFDRIDRRLTDDMIDDWRQPEDSHVMTWRNDAGELQIVFAGLRFGNVLIAAQPSRGIEEVAYAALSEGAAHAAMHDSHLAPHHQYTAFYLWLQNLVDVHAMVHVGTHATHEWLTGKEIGFTAWDPGEVMVGAVPQIYPYIVDDIGEGLQAKRRGMAALLSHMTPPFDAAGLSPELRILYGLVGDYRRNIQQSPTAAQATLADITRLADRIGLLADMGKTALTSEQDIDDLGHYLEEIGEQLTPFGLHTFGVSPSPSARRATAEAILSVVTDLSTEEREAEVARLEGLLERSGPAEMDGLISALNGQYVPAGPGNDPIRNPDSLPTGRNMYGVDPARMPSRGVWEQGRQLAEDFITEYRGRHDGAFPDRVTFTLWSTEAMRHEGVTEAQIMALMGLEPRWNGRGQLESLEVIPAAELGRPRVDVTIVATGLYRDTLPNLMLMLDSGVSKILALDEDAATNPMRANWLALRAALAEQGVDAEMAQRIAAVRIFTEPPGAYGTGVENMTSSSNLWDDEAEVADVYFNRVGFMFGQGFWGERPLGEEGSINIFKSALSGSKAVLHSRASNLFGVLDNDDVFQYMGGTAMAIRQIDGATPETIIVNLGSASGGRLEDLEQFLSREMRTRYLNPAWIEAMLDEGYAGSRFVAQTVDNLWGWEVTTPDAVDDSKWQEMYETYIVDRHGLGIEQRFRDNDNLRALQALTDRMQTVINKGYWDADEETRRGLAETNRRLIAEAGRACDALNCSSTEILQLDQAPVPSAPPATVSGSASSNGSPSPSAAQAAPSQSADSSSAPPVPVAAPLPIVSGRAIETIKLTERQQAEHPTPLVQVISILLFAMGLIGAGIATGTGLGVRRRRPGL